METVGFTNHFKKLLFYLNFSRSYEYFHTSKRVSLNFRLLEKMVNEDWVRNFFHFSSYTGNSLGRRSSNLMKLYMKLGNIVASAFF